jgi:DNA-binding SARP family transcriptional activator/tetratricopeptide (TPR) repeat protein
MWFALLGPLAVERDGSAIQVGGVRRRVLLAALLLEASTPVPAGRLLDTVWPDAPPDRARQALQNQVKRLRDALGVDGRVRLRTAPDGYVVDVADSELDIRLFAALADAGRAALKEGDPNRAERLLGEGLALWRGEPLCDLPERPAFTAAAEHWRARHLQATRWHLDALLRVGRPAEALVPLTRLARDHPLDEALQGQLMLALYRCHRQADALAAYDETRRLLVNELGIEPGEYLQRLHHQILRADSALAGPAAPSAVRTEEHAPPRQLPAAVRHFTGRTDQIRTLSQLAGLQDSPHGTTAIVTIDGTAGVGKTALAVRWAHQAADRFPDGQLYVNLRGFDPSGPPSDPAESLRQFLTALGVPRERIPAPLEERSAFYRSVVAGRRILVLLDNALDAEQVRPLLPGSAGCLVVVTSRNKLTSLVAGDGAQPLTLGLLNADEAQELLTHRLGRERIAPDVAAAAALIDLCARLPLALNIAAARAMAEPGLTLGVLAADLREAHRRLDALNAGDAAADVRAVFSWSYRQLSDDAARLFCLLGEHPGTDIAMPAAASLASLTRPQAHRILSELVQAHLLEQTAAGRFAYHDLLRAYAIEQSRSRAEEHLPAMIRMQDHYLHTAHAAALRINPARTPLRLPTARPGTLPEDIHDDEQAMAWFEAERSALLALIDEAATTGLDIHAWQISWCIAEYLDRSGRFDQLGITASTALAAASRLEDRQAQALTHGSLGRVLIERGSYSDGLLHLNRSLDLQRQLRDHQGEALTHTALAHTRAMQGEHRDALQHGREALRLYQLAGHRGGEATALNVIGWCHSQLGEPLRALEHCQQSAELFRELGHRTGEAVALDSIGDAHHRLGRYREAVACYQVAVTIRRELGQLPLLAATLTRLGETHLASGDTGAAASTWEQALAILDEAGHPDAGQVRKKLQQVTSRLDSARAPRIGHPDGDLGTGVP